MIYVGFLVAFWSTPTMTATHLVFASVLTLYILVTIQSEERNLMDIHGNAYIDYRHAMCN
jgi:methanethiol S-methyltransferase